MAAHSWPWQHGAVTTQWPSCQRKKSTSRIGDGEEWGKVRIHQFTNQPYYRFEVLKWSYSITWNRHVSDNPTHRLQRKYTTGSPGKVLGDPVSFLQRRQRRKLVQRHKTTTASGGSWKAHCFFTGSRYVVCGIDCEWEIHIYVHIDYEIIFLQLFNWKISHKLQGDVSCMYSPEFLCVLEACRI